MCIDSHILAGYIVQLCALQPLGKACDEALHRKVHEAAQQAGQEPPKHVRKANKEDMLIAGILHLPVRLDDNMTMEM